MVTVRVLWVCKKNFNYARLQQAYAYGYGHLLYRDNNQTIKCKRSFTEVAYGQGRDSGDGGSV